MHFWIAHVAQATWAIQAGYSLLGAHMQAYGHPDLVVSFLIMIIFIPRVLFS